MLTQLEDGKASIFMEMENRLAQVEFQFDVEWNFTIELDYTNENAPTYKLVDGNHKLFPLYELYIGDQRIYGYDGVLAGNGAGSLVQPFFNPFRHNISNREAGEPGVLEDPPFEGTLTSESRIFNECLSRHPDSRPATCN